MIYIKYEMCDGSKAGQHRAANTARDYILNCAFGLKEAESLIVKTERGKPYIKGAHFDFSTAHTENVGIAAACGKGEKNDGLICIDKDIEKIGIDIELESRKINGKSLSLVCKKLFSEREREYVALGTPGENLRFLEIWTKKESIVKATGEGIFSMHSADSFAGGLKYLGTSHIVIDGKKYIFSVAGI